MRTLTQWTLAHRRLVAAIWLAIAVIGIAATQPATNSLTNSFTLPGEPGFETNQTILTLYGTGGRDAPVVPVITLPTGVTVDTPGVRAQLAAVLARVQQAVPGTRIASYASTGSDFFVSADRRTTFALLYLPRNNGGMLGMRMGAATPVEQVVQGVLAGARIDGAPFHLTSTDLLETAASGSSKGGGMSAMGMTMFGILGALVVLAFVFGSWLAVVPIVMAVIAIVTTFLLVGGLTRLTEVSEIVQFVVALIGLGLAIDYSLLVVMRWREERAHGLENGQAVQRAMETAGQAVVFSGTTVAMGMLALVVLPVPFLRSMGLGGLFIPLVSVLVATTLLPVVLATIGPRLEGARSRGAHPSRFWVAWASIAVRWRWAAAIVAAAILAALAIPAFSLTLGNPRADALAESGDAYAGLQGLERAGIGPGVLTPFEVLVQGTSAQAVAGRLARVAGVRGAVAPTETGWRAARTALVDVVPTADGSAAAGRAALDRVRQAAASLPGSVRVGGAVAENADFVSAVYGTFPVMAALLAAITFLLLTRAFRSLLLALKAVVLAGLSVAVAWGLMTLIWQEGHGSQQIWGVPATGAVAAFVPLIVFAFLFGISMDYEVFLLSRIREEYERTGSTAGAVVQGMAGTGRLVTSAALILFIAFAALSTSSDVIVKTFATGLAAGSIVDATLIRMLLVPALVSLFGPWNWWLPSPVARLLRAEPVLRASAESTVAEQAS